MSSPGRRLVATSVGALALLVAGCGQDHSGAAPPSPSAIATGPARADDSSAESQSLIIDITIEGGTVTPTNARMQGTVDEPIVLRVNSDTTDELHVHSVPEHSFTVESAPGKEFQFRTEVPGIVEIELHELDQVVATVQIGPRR
ncbi:MULTISPECIES: hypothetical protein [Mycolicibacterium]|uniref:hypothetical protein n=1 Tax=Mycolicibacterium monacense TaxID=85693 RepID=UPI0007E9554C|nr:hypothetical protein [Mycolicibacterium monacense]OBB66067.1 hypothetical protein A6B34_22360 [Mycolicibacterium monacense]OBF53926.1 hypothetical protein A5778_11080 [Mycolicibacterium monacense]